MKYTALIIVAVIMILGTVAYIGTGAYKAPAMDGDPLYEGMRFKAAYAEGALKLFVLADADELAKLSAEGAAVPSDSAMVIGSTEAAMMREENLFADIGDPINGFFGIDTAVGGVLAPTNSAFDDAHFLSTVQFEALQGEEGRVYMKMLEGMPKFFYRLPIGESPQMRIMLAEGDMSQYRITEADGVLYQPLIIGSAEAAMMREEALFSQPGDTIRGFFGQDVIIIGIIERTNSSLDMMHIIPLPSEAMNSP